MDSALTAALVSAAIGVLGALAAYLQALTAAKHAGEAKASADTAKEAMTPPETSTGGTKSG